MWSHFEDIKFSWISRKFHFFAKLVQKFLHILQGFFPTIEALLYTKQNLTAVTIRRSKGFGIHPHIAKKSHTLLMSGTLGHTVVVFTF